MRQLDSRFAWTELRKDKSARVPGAVTPGPIGAFGSAYKVCSFSKRLSLVPLLHVQHAVCHKAAHPSWLAASGLCNSSSACARACWQGKA